MLLPGRWRARLAGEEATAAAGRSVVVAAAEVPEEALPGIDGGPGGAADRADERVRRAGPGAPVGLGGGLDLLADRRVAAGLPPRVVSSHSLAVVALAGP